MPPHSSLQASREASLRPGDAQWPPPRRESTSEDSATAPRRRRGQQADGEFDSDAPNARKDPAPSPPPAAAATTVELRLNARHVAATPVGRCPRLPLRVPPAGSKDRRRWSVASARSRRPHPALICVHADADAEALRAARARLLLGQFAAAGWAAAPRLRLRLQVRSFAAWPGPPGCVAIPLAAPGERAAARDREEIRPMC